MDILVNKMDKNMYGYRTTFSKNTVSKNIQVHVHIIFVIFFRSCEEKFGNI